MANQLRQQIEQISREKNINPDVIIAAIEDAILTASKKYYKNNEDLRSRFAGGGASKRAADYVLKHLPSRLSVSSPHFDTRSEDPDRWRKGA